MPTISETVRVSDEGPVMMEIKIGSGQIGGYSILLDSRKVRPKTSTPSKALYQLGIGSDLRYRVLIGTVRVKDVQSSTNQTTVTVTVRQGTTTRTFKDTEEATPGGIVNYGLAITFT